MRFILTVVALLALSVFVVFFVPSFFHAPTPLVTQNETIDSPADFKFEIVDTVEARAQGLSGRSHIPENYGMLFVFDQDDVYGFWMKDMLVAIDILWIDSNGVLVGIEKNVAPDTYPAAFYPPQPIRYVLETAVGESERQKWMLGMRISLPL